MCVPNAWRPVLAARHSPRMAKHSTKQNNAYNPLSDKSKKMIKDMGNVELFELLETDPQNAMQRVPYCIGI